MKKPLIADQNTGVTIGMILLVSAFVILHDAFEGHARPKPKILGPFLPW
jgi:hypothetical protein